MNKILFLIVLSVCFALYGCKQTSKKEGASDKADTIYWGGDILTMQGDEPQYVEALAVKDGKILLLGSKLDVEKTKGENTQIVDLEGKTLLPGFIDAHSHITTYADALMQVNLSPPPVGKITKIADIIGAIEAFKKEHHLSDTAWIVGVGYDQDLLAEKRHPSSADLDAVFATNPIILKHASSHMLVANSAAFKKAGVTAQTPDPVGGAFIRKNNGKELEGLVQEMAMNSFVSFLSKELPIDEEMDKLKRAQEYYASCGVTTAAEHMALEEKMNLFEYAAKNDLLFLDIVVLPGFMYADKLVPDKSFPWGKYNNHLKYGGLKILVDGSPQGKTAYLTQAYKTPVPGCTHDCKGFSNITQEDVNKLFALCYKNNVQLYSHCNGDASIDMMIKGHEYAVKELGDTCTDRRTVIVHSQIMRPDQLEAYKKYNLFPSFFTNHTFYWGDVHVANLGMARADFISPMKTAMQMGIRCTNHTDNTVTPMDQLFLLWTSINRLSRSGQIIGENERITPYQGLQALTINGAYEYFEEAQKGSLEQGKLADLVILDKNPLKVDPLAIKDISVLETIKEGKSVYKKEYIVY